MPHYSMYMMTVYTNLLDWRGNQPHKKMCCLSCIIVYAVSCYYDAAYSVYMMTVLTNLLDLRGNQPHKKMCCLSCTIVCAACCYYDAATTTTLLLRRCYYACSAAAILGSEQVLPWNLLQAVIAAIAMYAITVYTIAVD